VGPQSGNPDFTSLSPGTYYVVAEFTGGTIAPGCTSAPVQFVIADDADNPTVAIVQDAPNTICDPSFGALEADGQLTATVTGDADDNYDFQWYLGATGDVSTPINDTDVLNSSTVAIDESGTRTSVISNLSEGTYWVEITDNTTLNLGCTVSGEFTLTSNFTDVTLDVANVTANPATDCTSPNNGSIVIDLADIGGSGAAITDYTISIDGVNTNTSDNAALALSTDPETISGLEPDTYDIVITDETTGCVSDTYQVVVGQDGTEPTINVTVLNDDNYCTGGNGAITVEITAPDTDENNYDFQWYEGTGTTGSNFQGGTNITSATGLEANFYTIVVTALGTAADGIGCVDQIVVEVEDDPYVLEITNSTSNNVVDCTPDNGDISITELTYTSAEDGATTITGAGLNDADIDYTLYDDAALTSVVTGPQSGNPDFSSLSPGTYYVVAEFTGGTIAPGCSTPGLQFVIEDDADNPTIDIVQDAANTICDPTFGSLEATGQLTATVTGDADDNYDFQRYLGATGDVSTPINDTDVLNSSTVSIDESGTRTSVISNLSEGTYWVEVTDNTTGNLGCTVSGEFTLTSNFTDVTLDVANVTANPATDCTSPANGSIVIDFADISGSGGAITDYTISIDGVNTNTSDNAALALSTDPETISGLEPDTYDIIITDETTGCVSGTYQVVVGQEGTEPTINVTVLNDDNYCSGGNGAITVEITAPDTDENNYDFQWYEGSGTTGTNFQGGTNITSATGLEANFYTIVVTALGTAADGVGCVDQIIVEVEDDPYILTISASTSNDVSDCTPDNGDISVTELTYTSNEDGATTITGTGGAGFLDDGDITYTLYDDVELTSTVTSQTGNPDFTSLSPGIYYLTASFDAGSAIAPGCTSAPIQFEILDVSSLPEVSITSTSNTICDPSLGTFDADGILTATIGNDDGGTYTYAWYIGEPNSGTLIAADGQDLGNGSNPTDVTTATISGLAAGSYYVEVEDQGPTAGSDGCVGIATFVLENDNVLVEISIASTSDDTNCTSDNGTFTVNSPTSTRLGSVVASTYTLTYYDSTFTTIGTFTEGAEPTDLAAGTYYVTAYDQTYNCTSDFVPFEIGEDLAYPELTLTASSANMNCVNPDGSISIEAQTNGSVSAGGYSFEWFDGDDTSTAHANNGTDSGTPVNANILENLSGNTYTVRVTDLTTGCETIQSYILDDGYDIPVVTIPDAQITEDRICTTDVGDGQIVLTDSDISPGTLADYSISIRMDSIDGTHITGSPFVGSAGITASDLDAGEYFIVATNSSSECASAVLNVIVPDSTMIPELAFDQVANIGCGITSNGTLTITTVDGYSSSDAEFANYSFQWYDGSGTTTAVDNADGGNTNEITNQDEGIYTVVVTETTTGCTNEQEVELFNEQILPIIEDATIVAQTDCIGNGSAEVTEISYNGSSVSSATFNTDYTFTWYSGAAIITGETTSSISGLTAGDYSVEVLKNDDNCTSGPFEFTIDDSPILPELLVTLVQADSVCTGGTATGEVSATADGETELTDATYEFRWIDSSNDTVSFASTASTLDAGTYTAFVRNTTTGCTITQDIDVPGVSQTPDMELAATNLTTCNPLDASITVTSVSFGSITDYTYFLYDTDPSTGAAAIQTVTDGVMDSLVAGTYFVIGQNNTTACLTGTFEVEIEDNSAPPVITLTFFTPQTNCDPSNPNGTLTVAANGSSDPALYQFDWYDLSGNLIEANSATADSLEATDYRVVATDLASGCTSEEIFGVSEDIPEPIMLSTSSSPNTNCINPNGSVGVAVIEPLRGVNDYSYYWYFGTPSDPDPADADTTGRFIEGLPDGTYSVLVIDNIDGFCQSNVTQVVVEDMTETPDIEFNMEAGLTNCDPARPNGILSVSSPSGDIFRYQFDWWVGTDTTATSSFYTGLRVDTLEARTYAVLITDLITGCDNLEFFTITDDTEQVPLPSVALVANRTYCSEPNGQARASISGDTDNYTFDWYRADDPNTLIHTGAAIGGLDSTTYEVIATDINTGCVSERASIRVFFDPIEPEIAVQVVTNSCVRAEDATLSQLYSGQAFISVTNAVSSDTVLWYANVEPGSITGDGIPNLDDEEDNRNNQAWTNAPPGNHAVYYRAESGCATVAYFTVGTDIVVYNGVSDNGDGKNDFFLIDCIEYFPNNVVEIFNRAGAKVYEVEGYDNNTVRFEGYANTGVSLGATRLPEGTYYYVISKGDGSTNIQGFLQLVR
ncbi:MAG: gliding motility-associated C-terminal domain-containing protein, partial [bacterium]|nr:gliding motility-associated C-terminal domain-containing protein [bacterium]